ncbi:MAG: ribonuclease J [Clostridiales bacterium]|nr:ribonuclease J [Clostridiales bacterium]
MGRKRKQIKVIPLGGVGEIGRNMTAIEYNEDIILIDCGMSFPEDYMLGIDAVIPDFTFLEENREKIRALFITHGHDDHIGAIAYFLERFKEVPVYGTGLTLGLVGNKLAYHEHLQDADLRRISAGDTITEGCFKVKAIKVNHSVADSVAFAVTSPVGTLVFTGDFKVDFTPVDDEMIDLGTFAALGTSGVLALFMESTNVEREGYTMSERTVGKTFENVFSHAEGRIIVTTFASNIHRIQQIIDASIKNNRKICILGFSMLNAAKVARELGYLHCPDECMIDIDRIGKQPPNEVTVITTGSQGEPMAALSRMANSEYKNFNIMAGDTVVISATPVPGNEKMVSGVINKLFERGAIVVYSALEDVHVSGHACREELKLMYSLVKPKFFVPVHGEPRHLTLSARMIHELGLEEKNILLPQLGKSILIDSAGIQYGEDVHAGITLVDGLGVGDVGNVVLKDRQVLSEEGLIITIVAIDDNKNIISGPEVLSRGFVYMKESEELITQIKDIVLGVMSSAQDKKKVDVMTLKNTMRDKLKSFIYLKTKRRPMIMPVILEADTAKKLDEFTVEDFQRQIDDEFEL